MRWPFRRDRQASPPSEPGRDWAGLPALDATVDLTPPALASVLRLPDVSGTRPLPGRTDPGPVSSRPRGRVLGLARPRPFRRPALAHPVPPEPESEFEPAPEPDVTPTVVPRRTTRVVPQPIVHRPVLTEAVEDYVGEAREPLVPHRTTELDRLFHQQEAVGGGSAEMLALALAGFSSTVDAPPPRADDPKPATRTPAQERTMRRATLAQSRRLGLTPQPAPPAEAADPATEPTLEAAPPDPVPPEPSPSPPPTIPTPVEPQPDEPPPAEPAAVEPTPVEPTRVESAAVEPAPVEPERVVRAKPAAAGPAPVEPMLAEPARVEFAQVDAELDIPPVGEQVSVAKPRRRLGLGAPLAHAPRRVEKAASAPEPGPTPEAEPRPTPEAAPNMVPEPARVHMVPEPQTEPVPEPSMVPEPGMVPDPDTVEVPSEVVTTMRSAFGVDVGPVAVHRGTVAAERVRAVPARAVTQHGTVYLPDEAGHLDEPRTKALLAHELVHAVQQRALGADLPPEESPAGAALEAEAVATERWFLGAGPAPATLVHRPTTPQPTTAPPRPPKPGPEPGPESPAPHAQQRAPEQPQPDHEEPRPPDVPSPPAAQPRPQERQDAPDLTELKATVAELADTVTKLDSRRPEPPTPRELDDLAHRLYGRIRGNLRRELLVDRERSGLLADLR